MAKMTRRDALKVLGTGACAAACTAAVTATGRASSGGGGAPKDAVGMLYDATICVGCKACVTACTKANDLEPDTSRSGGLHQNPLRLNDQTKNIIKLQRSDETGRFSYMKQQCMHCIEPGCASGCSFKAYRKDEWGVVTWNPTACMGCRYCQISCPFNIPKFAWDEFNPKLVKCELCFHRLKEGLEPACTDVCPVGAVIYGTREELLAEAHRRIQENPGKYYEDRVYGEEDFGGTQVLYLSRADVPFEQLGLPVRRKSDGSVETRSVAEYGEKVHSIVYRYMAIPAAVYAVLAGVVVKRYKDHQSEAQEAEAKTGLPDQL